MVSITANLHNDRSRPKGHVSGKETRKENFYML